MGCRYSQDAVRKESVTLDNSFIEEYLPDATGLQLKVYLYGLMQCQYPSLDGSVWDALGITEQEAVEAFCYWQQIGLVRITGEKPLSVEYLPQPEDRGQKYIQPAKYSGLIAQLNTLTAPRQFGVRELSHVYDWMEVFGLDEGAVLELVSYCMEKKGRRVSINYISSVAENWAEDGIRTFEDAKKAIEKYDFSKHGAYEILKQWNKRRKPTKAEMALYEKWTSEWGFTEEAILEALPRLTVSGSPNFTYLDELLEQLRSQNLLGKDEIREDDRKTSQEKAFLKILFERAGKAGIATATQRAQVSMFLDTYHMPRELLLYAADQSRLAGEPFGKMKLLLTEWYEKGVRTVEDAEKYQKENKEEKKSNRRTKKTEYPEHTVSDEDFQKMFLDLDKDLYT